MATHALIFGIGSLPVAGNRMELRGYKPLMSWLRNSQVDPAGLSSASNKTPLSPPTTLLHCSRDMASAQASGEQPRRRGRRPAAASQVKPEPNDESLEVCPMDDGFDYAGSLTDASAGIETAAAEPQSTAAISSTAASCSCKL